MMSVLSERGLGFGFAAAVIFGGLDPALDLRPKLFGAAGFEPRSGLGGVVEPWSLVCFMVLPSVPLPRSSLVERGDGLTHAALPPLSFR